MGNKSETALTVRGKTPAIYNKISQVTAIQRAEAGAADYVAHITSGHGATDDIKKPRNEL